jgi:N-dimethylarginine dimethylaminohydrolase
MRGIICLSIIFTCFDRKRCQNQMVWKRLPDRIFGILSLHMASESPPPKYQRAAYGGKNWSPRIAAHRDEMGILWHLCGQNIEWAPLKQVLLHPPGPEIAQPQQPDAAQLLGTINWKLAQEHHAALVKAYQALGVIAHFVEPDSSPPPNLIFCADLFWMTPEGAILARPASTVRAGEERCIARRLANLGIPILRTLTGTATFEGADAQWVDSQTVLIGRGLRTNDQAIRQIGDILAEMGVEVIPVDLPVGTMHLMGILRFLDRDHVLCWPYRLAWKAIDTLKERGYQVSFIPDEDEANHQGALNFVTLESSRILMAAGNPITQRFLEGQGITCITVEVNELLKAAGGIGCLTGIIEREIIPDANQMSRG